MSNLSIKPMFAIPVGQCFFADADKLNQELAALFLQKESEGDKYKNPYPTQKPPHLFESDFNLFSWNEPCVQRLRQFMWENIGAFIRDVTGMDSARLNKIEIFSHTWFHMTRKGGYFSAHNHPMAAWSATYCVKNDPPTDGSTDSGVFRIMDPRQMASMYLDISNAQLKPPYSWGHINIPLRAGQMVIFPSYLVHEVTPYWGDSPRITVATNMWFKDKV